MNETGFIYFLIRHEARELSPYVLMIIPLTYILGLVEIWPGNVHGQAAFDGKDFMLAYFSVCIITFIIFQFQKIGQNSAA